MAERWADIPSEPGYQASSLGRVRNALTLRVKRSYVWTAKRYPVVLVCLGRRRSGSRGSRRVRVARVVCEAFHGPPVGRLALHRDNDSTNCRPGNLRWGTHQDNADDRARAVEAARRARVRWMRGEEDDEPQYVPACDDAAPF